MSPAIFVGMDVSQDTVDIAVQPGAVFQIVNDEPGIAANTCVCSSACMRKLLTILNAMVKSGTPWRVVAGQPT